MRMQPRRGPTPKRLHLGSLSHRQPYFQLQMQARSVLMRNKALRSSLYRTVLNPQLQNASAKHHAWRDSFVRSRPVLEAPVAEVEHMSESPRSILKVSLKPSEARTDVL